LDSARLSSGSRTEVRQPDRRDQEQLDGCLYVFLGHLERGRARRAAAVVDEDVDAAERLERLLDEAFQILRVRDVAADGEGSEALRLACELIAAAREHGDVRAFRAQRLGGSEAHSGGRAADDRRPAAETELHD
jgi:hypothetical protein